MDNDLRAKKRGDIELESAGKGNRAGNEETF